MLFYPIFHAIFFILQNKNIYLSTFITDICLFSSFAFRSSPVNYFFAFLLLIFQKIVLLKFFCHFERYNKSNSLTKTHYGYFPVTLSYIYIYVGLFISIYYTISIICYANICKCLVTK